MTGPGGPSTGETVTLLATGITAVLGAWLGITVARVDGLPAVLFVAGSTLLGLVAALLLTRPTHRPSRTQGGGTWVRPDPIADVPPADPGRPDGQRIPPTPPTNEAVQAVHDARVVLPLRATSPVPAAAGDQAWWTRAPATAAAPTRPAPVAPAAAPPLGTYTADTALVAQCPRCGSLRLDVTHEPDDVLLFRCWPHHHAWRWRAGTPWPAVTVRHMSPDPATEI